MVCPLSLSFPFSRDYYFLLELYAGVLTELMTDLNKTMWALHCVNFVSFLYINAELDFTRKASRTGVMKKRYTLVRATYMMIST